MLGFGFGFGLGEVGLATPTPNPNRNPNLAKGLKDLLHRGRRRTAGQAAWVVKRSGIGDFGGNELEHPRQWPGLWRRLSPCVKCPAAQPPRASRRCAHEVQA